MTQLRAGKKRADRDDGQAREQATRLEAEKAALGQRLDGLIQDLGQLRENLAAREAAVRELELAGARLETQLDGARRGSAGLQGRLDLVREELAAARAKPPATGAAA